MKMRSQRKRNNAPLVYSALAILGVGLLALAFFRAPVPGPLVEAGHTVARPFWSVQDTLQGAVFGAVAILDSKQSLYEENKRLYDELSGLRREAFATRLLREENQQLRRLLGRIGDEQGIAAAVLARPPVTPYDTIVIDAGENQQVARGDILVVEGGLAIGVVEKVLANSATAVLFSAPGERTPVLIQAGTTTFPTIAEGRGGGGFRASLPRDLPVKAGDAVFLPLVETIVFAEIEAVSADPADSFLEVLFQSPINLNTLRFVKTVPNPGWDESIKQLETAEAPDGNSAVE